MYVNPFLAGVLTTIGAEAVLILVAALIVAYGGKRR